MVQGWFRDLQQQADEDHHREWEERSSHSSNRAQRRGRNKMYRHEPSWPRQHQSKINPGRFTNFQFLNFSLDDNKNFQ